MRHEYFISRTLDAIPDLLALHAQYPQRYPHLLASNARGGVTSRYDILFACPQQTIFHKRASFRTQRSGDPESSFNLADPSLDSGIRRYDDEDNNSDFLKSLDENFQRERTETSPSDLPFTGGWFVYLGYELAADIERNLKLPAATDGLPVAFATRFVAAIIVDRVAQRAYIVCENEFTDCLEQIQHDIQNLSSDVSLYQQAVLVEILQEDDAARYLEQVKRIRQYILDGDVFQVNLSRGWRTKLKQPISHASLFWHLARANPGPFNALMTLNNSAVISSSPERLVDVRNGVVQTRPIAGTRPRARDAQQDAALSAELLRHPKERAEHIMLIDLERNDLGRICQPGSVQVNELMVLESYQHVHHIVSNVRGRLREGVTPGDVIRAVFPGGTITGCPKVRCMEILAELEQTDRGAYTGSLGYLNRDGSMDLNILIRTLVRHGDDIMFRAGGGIVADSNPEHELNETRAKARGLINALLG
jgi:anthranilate synthase component 1